MKQAKNIYREWNQKDPDEVVDLGKYEFNQPTTRLGPAVQILYSSDKWEKDGDFFDYYHDFESMPSVYGPAKRGDSLVDVCGLLHADDLDSKYSIPWLAEVESLTYFIGRSDRPKEVRFKNPRPIMTCTADKRTLIILATKPYFIRGGKMRVTERGIVY